MRGFAPQRAMRTLSYYMSAIALLGQASQALAKNARCIATYGAEAPRIRRRTCPRERTRARARGCLGARTHEKGWGEGGRARPGGAGQGGGALGAGSLKTKRPPRAVYIRVLSLTTRFLEPFSEGFFEGEPRLLRR